MAQRVVTQLISDLSGEEIGDDEGETIDFSYRGVRYTIDLTAKEASGFDKSIAMYLEHATRVGSSRTSSRGAGRSGQSDAKAVRVWAKEQGLVVPDRGRIPSDVRDKYKAAH